MENSEGETSHQSLNAPAVSWNWESANYFADWHEPIIELLSRYVPRHATVLEVGAGASHTLGALAGRLHCIAFGIEPDIAGIRKTIELAGNESGEVSMIRGDGFLLPFEHDRFDVVYSLGLVEHFTPSESDGLISEHVRVCRPGGCVIVAVPNWLNLPHTLRKMYLGKAYEYAPERSLTPGQLKGMLTAAGLETIGLDGLHSLWGLGMSSPGWLAVRFLRATGIAKLLDGVKSARVRARIGYMTYAIGRKSQSSSNSAYIATQEP